MTSRDTNAGSPAGGKTPPARMRLYSGRLSMFGAKVQIAALEKGLDCDVVMVPFDQAYEPKHPEVVRVNPRQQVPVLLHGAVEIFDSTQIFEYFEDVQPTPALWPAPGAARALARQWEMKSDEVYFPHIVKLMGLQLQLDSPVALAAQAAAQRFYGEVDAQLKGRDYLAGAYSYADIAFYMAQFFGARLGAPTTTATPTLLQWRARMTQRPAVAAVVGPMVEFLRESGRVVPAYLERDF